MTRHAAVLDLELLPGEGILDALEWLTLIMGLVRACTVSGAFDVPASWTESDDPGLARRIAEVTERTLTSLPSSETAVRSRLLVRGM